MALGIRNGGCEMPVFRDGRARVKVMRLWTGIVIIYVTNIAVLRTIAVNLFVVHTLREVAASSRRARKCWGIVYMDVAHLETVSIYFEHRIASSDSNCEISYNHVARSWLKPGITYPSHCILYIKVVSVS